jgi:hypothetical protein
MKKEKRERGERERERERRERVLKLSIITMLVQSIVVTTSIIQTLG